MSTTYVAPIWPIGYAPLAIKPMLHVSFIDTPDAESDLTITSTSKTMGVFDAVVGADMSFESIPYLTGTFVVDGKESDIAAFTSDVETLAIRNGGVKITIPMTSPEKCATVISVPKQSYRYDGFV